MGGWLLIAFVVGAFAWARIDDWLRVERYWIVEVMTPDGRTLPDSTVEHETLDSCEAERDRWIETEAPAEPVRRSTFQCVERTR
ncbi:hypothetical protein [Terricaulis sp.]|uniref:hypothetical protein n=1 Tax=Terricaulis sp. TaxID=2768686 RepID=UPI002AC3ADF7|nr:hypothetical protein [Terricaulis sp.]MDZ4689702.1 hypothetical protein [Terricaulis sp.]